MTAESSRRCTIGIVLCLGALQALLVAGYFLVQGAREVGDEAPLRYERLQSGLSLPDVRLERPTGATFSAGELRGRPVLLHFWATWCPPCREELPALLELRERGDIHVVAVSLDDDWGAVERFFGGNVPPAVVRDPSGALKQHYEVTMLPDSYLLDEAGVATTRFHGPRKWGSDVAAEAIGVLLASERVTAASE